MTDPDDYSAICAKALPYLDINALEGRRIPLHSFHDGNRWHFWLLEENGRLQPIRVLDCMELPYLASKPVHWSDDYFSFVDFIYKHIDTNHTHSFVESLISDVFNLGASLRKIDLLRALEDCGGKSRLVTTELEYLLVVCRRIFDLLQEIISRIWDTISLLDTSIKKKELPKKFSGVVLHDKAIRSPQEIQDRFGLPPKLATWYSECAPFFNKLKKIRDEIIHQPNRLPLIFFEDKGLSIEVNSSFGKTIEWPEDILESEQRGPLNYFIAHFIHETLVACENL
jgi:hypothetical protein